MATYVYSSGVTAPGYSFKFYSYITYSVSVTATTYSVTLTAGVKSGANNVGWPGIVVKVAGTDQKSYEKTINYNTSYADSQYRQVAFNSWTWSWSRTTYASTKNVYCKLTLPEGSKYTTELRQPFTVPALDSYTIAFDSNGAGGGPTYQTKYYGINIALDWCPYSRSGYNFVGWGTSPSSTSVAYYNNAIYSANAGAYLYAIWQKPVTVSYNANGGSGAPNAQTAYMYNYDDKVSIGLYSTVPSRLGYNFNGWNSKADGSGTAYGAGGVYNFSDNITLYAQWTANQYSLSYNLNGGTVSPANPSSYFITDTPFTLRNPKRNYYRFLGWTGTGLTTTTKTVTIPANGTGDRSYTALWEDSYVSPTMNLKTVRRDGDDKRGITNPDDFDDGGEIPYIEFEWTKGTIQLDEGDSSTIADVIPTGYKVTFIDQSTDEVVTLPLNGSYSLSTSPVKRYYDDSYDSSDLSKKFKLDTNNSYSVEVTLLIPAAGGETRSNISKRDFYSQAYFIMDINPDGTAIGFGESVKDTDEGFFCAMPAHFQDASRVVRQVFDLFYPIGSCYETYLTNIPPSGRTTDPTQEDLAVLGQRWFNPHYAWGGTWVLEEAGRVHVSAGTVGNKTYTAGDTGGSADAIVVSHSHTVDSHTHHIPGLSGTAADAGYHSHGAQRVNNAAGGSGRYSMAAGSVTYTTEGAGTHSHTVSTSESDTWGASPGTNSVGSSGEDANMMPYIVVYRWFRTA